MSLCDKLDAYLNRRLVPTDVETFERHLDDCRSCVHTTDKWQRTRGELDTLITSKRPYINEASARAIVAQARADSGRSVPVAYIFAGAAVLAATMVIGLISLFSTEPPRGAEPPLAPLAVAVVHPTNSPAPARRASGTALETDDRNMIATLGDGRLGLSPHTKMIVEKADKEEIRLRLDVGRLAVSLPKRRGQAGLTVRIGRLNVAVTGTVFVVERDTEGRIGVSVTRGSVRVNDPDAGTWRVVSRGETLEKDAEKKWQLKRLSRAAMAAADALFNTEPASQNRSDETARDAGAARAEPGGNEVASSARRSSRGAGQAGSRPSPAKRPQLLTLDEIKQLILEQTYGPAEQALKTRLKNNPRESATLELLAIQQHRSGHPEAAVSTYEDIIKYGSPIEKSRARFRAGSILQDRLNAHAKALRMFQAYLDDPQSTRKNAAEVKLRMAKSYQKMGNTEKLRQVLKRIVEEHGGTSAAEKAGQALKRLSPRAPDRPGEASESQR